jgi:putative transposase
VAGIAVGLKSSEWLQLNVFAKRFKEHFTGLSLSTRSIGHGLFDADDLMALGALAEAMTSAIHLVPWPKRTHVGQFWLLHTLSKEEVLGHIGSSLRWPMHGLPERVHVDNAREFHSKALQRGCEEYGIELSWRPIHRPHFGGHIERLIGTMMGEVHLLPGTTFSSAAERGQYDSSERALLTLSELEEWLILQICGIYHRTPHSSTKLTPLAAWENSVHHRPGLVRVPQNAKQLYIDFLPFKVRKARREGLRIFNIFYCCDGLSALLRTSSKSLAVHYDPRNLSCVYVKDKLGEYLEIPYRNLSHPAITLEEHIRATRELRNAKHPQEDEEAKFAAIEARRQLIAKGRAKTKKARREAQKQAYALQSAAKRGSSRVNRQSPESDNHAGTSCDARHHLQGLSVVYCRRGYSRHRDDRSDATSSHLTALRHLETHRRQHLRNIAQLLHL